MEPNDTQPGGSPNRTVTIQLTRDTLILIAALAFLLIAILLAVIFPGQSSGPASSTATNVPGGQITALPTSVRETPAGSTPIAGSAAPSAAANPPAAYPSTDYPAPGASPSPQSAAVLPTSTPGAAAEAEMTQTSGGAEDATTSPIPSFAPERPTQPAVGTPSGFSAQASAYPPPVGATETVDTPVPATTTPASSGGIRTPTIAPTSASTSQLPQTQPTIGAPAATPRPRPTPPPQPTAAPTAPPVDVLRGNVRWSAAQSPIFVRRDLQLVAGATLIVDQGVEVRFAPGASFFVDGTLYALGKADQPVRFVGSSSQRWEGIFGRTGSDIAMEYTEIRGGGNGGTVLISEGGNLVLRHARVSDNGGHIQVIDSRLEMRDSEIAGNDMPYGSALEVSYTGGNGVILTNNRIGGNRIQPGTSPVRISSQSAFDTLNLDIQGNLLVGTEGPDLALFTNGPLQGGLTCNTLTGGPDGLSLRSDLPQVPGFALNVGDNAVEKHTPPIIPLYLKYGIGRGATSELALDMRRNWWGSPLGPYEPDRNADGRGDAVGDNIEFGPWLTERPACAPHQ